MLESVASATGYAVRSNLFEVIAYIIRSNPSTPADAINLKRCQNDFYLHSGFIDIAAEIQPIEGATKDTRLQTAM